MDNQSGYDLKLANPTRLSSLNGKVKNVAKIIYISTKTEDTWVLRRYRAKPSEIRA